MEFEHRLQYKLIIILLVKLKDKNGAKIEMHYSD